MFTLKHQLQRAVDKLEERNFTYALAGGIAASIYGDQRTTKDVDFLVGGKDEIISLGQQILAELGLSTSIARQADLEGGPLFAIKRKKTPELIIIGRDPKKLAPGVDFLLPGNPWAPRALDRAQSNALDFGFRKIPTLTVEDIIVCKLLAAYRPHREQDILDLRSIFGAKHDLDVTYLAARMKEFHAAVPKTVEQVVPSELLKVSRRIVREQKKSRSKSPSRNDT